MATQQQMDDLLAAVGAINAAMANLATERGKLEGYKATKQEYAALVDEQKLVVDAAAQGLGPALKDLAAKISAVYP